MLFKYAYTKDNSKFGPDYLIFKKTKFKKYAPMQEN